MGIRRGGGGFRSRNGGKGWRESLRLEGPCYMQSIIKMGGVLVT